MKENIKYYLKKVIFPLIWLGALVLSIFWGYDYLVSNVGFRPDQPVEFSHKVHSGDYGMKCLFCHYTSETSNFTNVPTTYECMICHNALKNETDLMKPVNISLDSSKPIIWKKVYNIPDFTHFSHKAHIKVFIDCSSCHGDVETMEKVYQVRSLNMKWCLDCHRDPAKYIKPPKQITGYYIPDELKEYINKENLTIIDYESLTEPYFGMYKSKNHFKNLSWVDYRLPGKGPENCSACHY